MTSRREKGTGSISEREGRFQARYSFEDVSGKRRWKSKTFDTKTEARKWLTERLAKVDAGEIADAGALTVGEYLSDWLASLALTSLEENTIAWYRAGVEKHIIPVLGGVRLSKLTPIRIEAFLAEKAENGRLDGKGGLGPSSLRRLQITLHKSLDAAVRKGLLSSNPADVADKPKVPARDVTEDVWSPEVIAAFLDATSDDREHPIWRLACWTGLRRAELCGLQWPDVDLDAGTVSVRRSRTLVEGMPVVKGPKSAASRRTVDIDSETIRILKAWKVEQLEERLRAGTAWEPGEWVFTNEMGEPWRPDTLTRALVDRIKELGLPRTDMKGLRHAHATALLKAGTNPKIVQERLGHSSISVTMDIYSSVLPGMQREAVEKLAAMMGGE